MPSVPVLSGQDFEPVNVGRNAASSRVTVPKSAAGVDRLKAMGILSTEKKFGSGSNSSAHSGSNVNARKIEESDELKINKVDKSLSKAIQQARMAKKLTQKELATKINEKPQVVGEYENGKAVPNAQIINKLERELGVKLPRPGKKPVDAAKKAAGGGVAGTRGGLVAGGPPKRR
jgi:putative transcription factor